MHTIIISIKIIDPSLFKVTCSLLCLSVLNFIKLLIYSQYMQFSIAAADVGFVFIANALPYVVCSPISGILADKFVSLLFN